MRRVPEARRRSASCTIFATVSAASFLLVPITPLGPRLIQPTTYSPREREPVVAHAAAIVADQAAALVERHVVDGTAAVADRAQHEPAFDLLQLTPVATARRPPVASGSIRLRTTRTPRHRTVLAVTQQRDGRAQEAQADAMAVPRRLAVGVLAQQLDVAPRGGVGLLLEPARRCARRARGRRRRRARRRAPARRARAAPDS